MTRHIPEASLPQVREALTNYLVTESGCWLWQGHLDRNGYGRVTVRGTKHGTLWVHRASYEVHKDGIPDRFEIDHTCCVTRCMNPEHLEAVTKAEHAARTFRRLGKDERHLLSAHMRLLGMTYTEIADALDYSGRSSAAMAVKEAIRKGLVQAEAVPRARHLGPVEREDIRDLYALGVPQTALARMYSVDDSHVSRICSGRSSSNKRDEVA